MTGVSSATLTIMAPFCTKSCKLTIPRSGAPRTLAVVPAPVIYSALKGDSRATCAEIPDNQLYRNKQTSQTDIIQSKNIITQTEISKWQGIEEGDTNRRILLDRLPLAMES
jgi:hypothetical protein